MEGHFKSSLETMDFSKLLCHSVYFCAIFYVTGYRVWRALPNTPVTSLVKYPQGIIHCIYLHLHSDSWLKSVCWMTHYIVLDMEYNMYKAVYKTCLNH